VKRIYEADTCTLEIHHLRKDGDDSDEMLVGYTPLHFLSLEESPNGRLMDYFALKSPESFAVMTSCSKIPQYAKLFDGRSMSTISTGSCLHLLAKHNMYNSKVIQSIIKVAPKMVMTKGYGYDTPLSGLCGRYGVTNGYDNDNTFYCMFYCLLHANHSPGVIKSPPVAILLKDVKFVFLLGILLNANPEVAGMPTVYRSFCRNENYAEQNIFQVAASLLKGKTRSI
jgi:hypothetical protein